MPSQRHQATGAPPTQCIIPVVVQVLERRGSMGGDDPRGVGSNTQQATTQEVRKPGGVGASWALGRRLGTARVWIRAGGRVWRGGFLPWVGRRRGSFCCAWMIKEAVSAAAGRVFDGPRTRICIYPLTGFLHPSIHTNHAHAPTRRRRQKGPIPTGLLLTGRAD